MNRKIKFRVWDRQTNSFISSPNNLVLTLFGDCQLCLNDKTCGCYPVEEKILVLQQFIGLLDKNGKEIYEGDIIKYNDKCIGDDEGIGEVFYCTDLTLVNAPCFCLFQLERNKIKKRGVNPYFPFDSEIIGNIFQNPELVK